MKVKTESEVAQLCLTFSDPMDCSLPGSPIHGIFQAKMGTIKDRNGMNLTEMEDIKKRWQEYTEQLYKKDLSHPVYQDGVVTHLEPDILECKHKWPSEASLWTKLVGVMEFQLSYFKS